ncbi:hypothetical protein, partial [Methylacidiphilum kamchatkense]|uniref:hypothetical protein n=1 Tax=Methylacidiphilum kamchatkense TaxID=431057 RepID=UPI00126A0572
MRRLWKTLGSLMGVGLAGLISVPALAAGQPANPYAGLPPMTAWYWADPYGNSPEVMFDFGGNFEAFPFSVNPPVNLTL